MRKILFACVLCVSVALSGVGVGNATPIDFSSSYTADNYVDSFTISSGGTTIASFGSKTTSWQSSATVSSVLDFKPGTEYTATWTLRNVDYTSGFSGSAYPASSMGSGNPMAFVGQLTVGGATYTSSANGLWKVDGANPFQYGTNGQQQLIWTTNNGNNGVGGIPVSAYWIGSSKDGSDANGLFTVTASFKTGSPTPVPGAVWLLGSGLLGVMGFKRTRKAEQA